MKLIDASDYGYSLPDAGEVCIRGGHVCKGYYKDPELSAQVFLPDGFAAFSPSFWLCSLTRLLYIGGSGSPK